MNKVISAHFQNASLALQSLSKDINKIEKLALILEKKIKLGKKVFVYGNGGSFADSSHFVGELTATYKRKNRKGLPFFLLSSNLAAVTAWANDFNFDQYLKREFSTLANKGDVLIIFSTSGGNIKNKQSLNLIELAKYAKKNSNEVICFLGKGGGSLKKLSKNNIIIKSNDTGTIQEMHKIIFHAICAFFENKF
jgi:D-sedoheptulose 7-phosphate isomerase